ncbi:MAG: hypothetical protein COV44_01865 [Deltaproteobacteria bacterium CG11_big_fil_rev_8_21_14_0_20_45_16]|nr:MAG: hypothetical protein COV44_01865 [Deltaproteobacteria bacterium CG11_big_fil_rev_8_21_14_0_20_45_16]
MQPAVRNYMARIGRKGGQKSRRSLDSEEAKLMVSIREARRAFRKFHTECFWSYDPTLKIAADDLSWVKEQLIKYGGREAWKMGSRLCR